MPVACVTGAGVRVGRAIALALGQAGFDVVLHANRSADAAHALRAELATLGRNAWVEVADLSDRNAVNALGGRIAAQHPALDVLVNSAAVYELQPFANVSAEAFDRMWTINVSAPYFLTQKLLPSLRNAPRPAIINITDVALGASYDPNDTFSHYLASKGALQGLTQAWAIELAPHIRVNAVAPGTVAVPAATSADDKQRLLARVPLAREGSPEDVARAVVFLAKDAGYMTGQTLRVDGGLSAS